MVVVLGQADAIHWESIFASHTFHEIQMYYPMRVFVQRIQTHLEYSPPATLPFRLRLVGCQQLSGTVSEIALRTLRKKTVRQYIHRPEFEFFKIDEDSEEANNLAGNPKFAEKLEYIKKSSNKPSTFHDPWVMKWSYE